MKYIQTIPLTLCSKSPRRIKLLKDEGLKFNTLTFESDESFPPNLKMESIPIFISNNKWRYAKSIISSPHTLILTADTMVFLDQKPLGKPKDRDEAIYFLKSLSNNTHFVVTGFSLGIATNNDPLISKAVTSKVTFRSLSNDQITTYVDTGSPFDKAGGYGFQDDMGSEFVKEIEGLKSNVIGLPVEEVVSQMLNQNWLVSKK